MLRRVRVRVLRGGGDAARPRVGRGRRSNHRRGGSGGSRVRRRRRLARSRPAPRRRGRRVGRDVSAVVDGAAPLALVLATPVACGALDGAVRAGDVAGDVDALGPRARVSLDFSRRRRRIACAARALRADDPDADAADDGATLGVAGLATLLAFPAKTKSLTTEDALGAAVDALVDAATTRRFGECSTTRRRRVGRGGDRR